MSPWRKLTDVAAPSPDNSVQVIKPTRGLATLDFAEFWRYRELFFFLAWRDVKVRYKQTAIGIAWAVLQPLALMVVFTLFFGRLAKIEQELDIPYALFAYAGLLPWQLFARCLSESTSSLVTDQRLITKVYFPRIIVPTATCLAALVDFLISAVLLVGLMGFYRAPPSANIIWFPLFVLLMLVTALGVGLWLSALNTEYRDVMYTIPFLTQFWLFITPVVYPSSMVPEKYRWALGLNPMTGVVEGMRWSLFGYGDGPGPMLAASTLAAVFLLLSGIVWFRCRERTFVDCLGGI